MAKERKPPIAGDYSYGTEGSAALAGKPYTAPKKQAQGNAQRSGANREAPRQPPDRRNGQGETRRQQAKAPQKRQAEQRRGAPPKGRQRAARPKAKSAGVPVPRWALLVGLVVLFAVLLTKAGNINEHRELAQRQLMEQEVALAQAEARIRELDEKLIAAADNSRIRSHSLNRLGMQEPVEEQIRRIPPPYVAREGGAGEGYAYRTAGGDVGFFQTLLSVFD